MIGKEREKHRQRDGERERRDTEMIKREIVIEKGKSKCYVALAHDALHHKSHNAKRRREGLDILSKREGWFRHFIKERGRA